jgi:hypothetical protein
LEFEVNFVYYTEMSVAECRKAMNARLGAKIRGEELEGWFHTDGSFSIGIASAVAGRFKRKTFLAGKVERNGGVTVINGRVADGVPREGQVVIFAAFGLLALALLLGGQALPALLLVPLSLALYIPMRGDHHNSAILMGEMQRTFKAKSTIPGGKKSTSETKSTTVRSVKPATKPTAAKAGTSAKTSASKTTAKPKSTTAKSASKPAAAKPRAAAKPAAAVVGGAPRPAPKPAAPPPAFLSGSGASNSSLFEEP